MNQTGLMSRYFPWVIVAWVFGMLMSLKCGWFDAFFWAAQHAHVQGIDYFALPKSFLNLLEHRSMYDSWNGVAFGPYATWYLAHPLFSILVMPWFAFLPPWLSYIAFVLFSLSIMIYCGALFARHAATTEEKPLYYGFFLLAFPLYWMFYVGNMHAPLVCSIALILLALYEMGADVTGQRGQKKLLFGLLLSFFTKPVVILLVPILLLTRETRRTMIIALVIYTVVSCLMLFIPLFNPEHLSWKVRLSAMLDFSFIKETMNIYKNQYILTTHMKDNAIHWFNLIAQSGYRFNHIENFSFPVFMDTLFSREIPSIVFLSPILICLSFACCLPFIQDRAVRLRLLLLLVMLSSTSFFLSYNTVWEYQYTSMLPIVAMIYLSKDYTLFTEKQRTILLTAGSFFYLPSFYCFLDQTNMDTAFVSMIRVSRELPTLVFFILMGYQLFQLMKVEMKKQILTQRLSIAASVG
jgi:hypothetical protein